VPPERPDVSRRSPPKAKLPTIARTPVMTTNATIASESNRTGLLAIIGPPPSAVERS